MEEIKHAKEITAVDLGDLLDACDDAVVTLVAGETRLVAHRAVLMDRSPVFGAMFRHDTLESRSGQVDIVDVEGPVLRQLLTYLYTLQDSQLPDIAPQLLAAADKYGVSALKDACEHQVEEKLSVETAAAAAVLAVRHSCPSLRQAAVAYIKAHLAEVMATQAWADAVRMQPEDVDEVRKLLSETSSPTPTDSGTSPTQPLLTVDIATTAKPLPQPRQPWLHLATLFELMTPPSVAWESSVVETIQHPKETTAVDLGSLLDACDDDVVTLVAGFTRLVAHRAVLIDRCPMFAAMFRNDTLESRSGQVDIADVEGPVLRQLLSYIYTLRAPQLPGMAPQLLAAANKYGLDSLKVACEQQVAAQLSVETAAAAAVLAVRHSCESLRKASIAFLMDHTHQVMASRGWKEAMLSEPDDLMEVSRLLLAEIRSLSDCEKGIRLIEAAKMGAVWELEALLEFGTNVEFGDFDRWTALHYAASGGHVEAARRLIAHGASVNARNGGLYTPLHAAVGKGHPAMVRLLLAASADHSAKDIIDRMTPLHMAAYKGNAEIAAALLDAGAYRAPRNSNGDTPLDLARQQNHQQLVDLLRET